MKLQFVFGASALAVPTLAMPTGTVPEDASASTCVATPTNYVYDSGFEDSPSGWQTQNGGYIESDDPSHAYSGNGYAELNCPQKNSTAGISQTFPAALDANVAYDLIYYYNYAGLYSPGASKVSGCVLTVKGDNTVLDTIYPNSSATGYMQRSITVVNTTFSTLSFKLSRCSTPVNRAYIDQVTLESVNANTCAFILQMTAAGASSTEFNNQYLAIQNTEGSGFLVATADASAATQFFLDSSSYVASVDGLEYATLRTGQYGNNYYGYPGSLLHFGTGYNNGNYGYTDQKCTLTASQSSDTIIFNCLEDGNEYQPYYCSSGYNNFITFGLRPDTRNCEPYDLNVVYVNQ